MEASHAAHDSRLNDFTIIFTRCALNPFTLRVFIVCFKCPGSRMFMSIFTDLFATQLRRVLNPIRHLYLYVAAFSLPPSFVVSLFLQNKFNLHSLQSLQPMLAKYIVNRTHISLENEKQSTKDGRNYSLHLQASVKH